MKNSKNSNSIILFIVINIFAFSGSAFPEFIISQSTQDSKKGIVLGGSIWKYNQGDDPAWAEPEFNDSAWEEVSSLPFENQYWAGQWSGIGWFRTTLTLDSSMAVNLNGIRTMHSAALEIYLDGRLIRTYGVVSQNTENEEIFIMRDNTLLNLINFEGPGNHLLAIRYSNQDHLKNKAMGGFIGFEVMIGDLVHLNKLFDDRESQIRTHQLMFTTASLVFAMIHLMLFLYNRESRGNLFYAALTVCCAGLAYFPFQAGASHDLSNHLWNLALFKFSLLGIGIFGPLFLYSVFLSRIPGRFWILLSASVLMIGLIPLLNISYFYIMISIAMIEMLWVLIHAARRNCPGCDLIAAGYMIFIACSGIQMLYEVEWILHSIEGPFFIYLYGILALLVSMSMHLAKSFSDVNKNLMLRLEQINVLSDKSLLQQRQAREQEIKRALLEKEVENKEKQLQEANRLEQALGELKVAHSQLQQADERLRTIIDASPVPLIVTRIEDGIILYANNHLGRLVGYSIEELEGKSSPDFYFDPKDRSEVVKLLERDGLLDNHEVRIKHRDGKVIWCLFSLVSSQIGDDKVIIGGLYDISERRNAQRETQKTLEKLRVINAELKDTQTQLVQSGKMASLGMLVAGVAHEINTPVGAIHSMQNTLGLAIDKLRVSLRNTCQDQLSTNPEIEKTLKIIDDSRKVMASGSERVTAIVRRLKSFARLDEAEMKEVNINEGIEDTLVLVQHELKHRVEVKKELGDIPKISCYPGLLNQVFLNLLVNASQAIEGKGEIGIKSFSRDSKVIVEISDNGHGMSPDVLERIFDPGYTTRGVGVGTGLGLSICYRIVAQHRGEIAVSSTVSKGTTFTVTLPINLNQILDDESKAESSSKED